MIRECEWREPLKFVEYNGTNWQELDEFVGEKGEYQTNGVVVYEMPNGTHIGIETGEILVSSHPKGLIKRVDYFVLERENFNYLFRVIPLPIEQKIMGNFGAKEEL